MPSSGKYCTAFGSSQCGGLYLTPLFHSPRDNDATAPAEFPPEQPEADLAPDDEDYGADEAEDDGEEAAGVAPPNGESSAAGEDAAMIGITAENGEHAREDDEMSEDGSVDIDGESEDEIEEEEEELEGQPAEGDGMDVDMDDAPDSG